jgi:hypothetical protein
LKFRSGRKRSSVDRRKHAIFLDENPWHDLSERVGGRSYGIMVRKQSKGSGRAKLTQGLKAVDRTRRCLTPTSQDHSEKTGDEAVKGRTTSTEFGNEDNCKSNWKERA